MIKSIWTPILTGQLIRLRPIAEGDFNSLYAVACDPELWKLHSEPNRYEEKVFRSFLIRP